MKILAMIPVWKRPEILRLFLFSLNKNKDIEPLFIVSPEDPHIDEILSIIPEDSYICTHRNYPFGAKKNTGYHFAKSLEWDYLMELNSDSIVNPALLDLYKPYMERGVPFFGLRNLYAVDLFTKRCIFIPNYNTDMTYGAGQMLSRKSAFLDKLWTNELNEGMDTNKIVHLRKAGIPEVVVDNGEVPMIVDIKTNTTITHFIELERYSEKEVTYEFLTKHIGYDFINSQ